MAPSLQVLSLPENLQVREALERVLRLPSVASKRYLTNKVSARERDTIPLMSSIYMCKTLNLVVFKEFFLNPNYDIAVNSCDKKYLYKCYCT